MRVLITGAAGFIGSHLVDKYLALGHKVIGLDNLSTGSRSNLEKNWNHPMFEFVEHDVTSKFEVDAELIFNLACPASPVHYQKTPIQTLLTSFIGTVNCLELARNSGARLVHASTSEVYGDPEVSPQAENYVGSVNPIGPRACYDEGKRAAETAIFDYRRIYNIDARVIRIFNTYGPRMQENDGRVVSNFIVSAMRGEPLTIYGDGSQTRSFCFVDDTVEAFAKMAELHDFPETPINVGNPNEISMRSLAQMILEITASKSSISNLPLPQDDPRRRCPDISKAREILKWSPTIDLKVGLIRTKNFFSEILLS